MYNNYTRPVLRQFPNTCESGPGTPSGHLMMNVAIFFIFVRSICTLFIYNNRLISRSAQTTLSYSLYAVYIIWITLVFISRLYIQAHFIHQCTIGVVLGIVIGDFCWKCDKLCTLGMVKGVALSTFFFLSAGGVWLLLIQLGHDPTWSVDKALKYCYDPVHVKVDTQPYFIIARFTGAAFGLGK